MTLLRPTIVAQLLMAAMMGALLVALLSTPAQSAFPGANGKIAFYSNAEIYLMNADGTGQSNLTNNPGTDYAPVWSPEGAMVAFYSDRDGNSEVYVMNADGSGQTRLTNSPASDAGPAWSPDGAKITFYSYRDGNGEIYTMNADGTGPTRLTYNPAEDIFPAWSPDGTKIAFFSERDGNREVYVMNVDGSGQTRLTNSPTFDDYPVWSPDGTKIAFSSDRAPDGNQDVYVMNADGSGQTNLTNNPTFDGNPAWSPDGTKIAFTSNRATDSNPEVYVMNADGTGATRLTNNPGINFDPDWQPLVAAPTPTPTPSPTPTPTATSTPLGETETPTPLVETRTPTPQGETPTPTPPVDTGTPIITPTPTPSPNPTATQSPTPEPSPANDNFASATVVPLPLPFTANQSTLESTLEASEPQNCSIVGSTVWYRFTPTQAGTIKITTAGSDYDTAIAVYTGTDFTSPLTLVGCNDDFSTFTTSAFQFNASAGTTYRIQIGSVEATPGTLQLDIVSATAPGNDNFASAVTVTPLPFTDNQNTIVATTQPGEPESSCGFGMGRTVWYNFTPSLPGTVTVNTTGSSFDTILAVYTGLTLPTLLEVDCSDDFGAGTTSQVQFTGVAGVTYRIQAGGFNGVSGNMTLDVSQLAASPTVTDSVTTPSPSPTPSPTPSPSPSPTPSPTPTPSASPSPSPLPTPTYTGHLCINPPPTPPEPGSCGMDAMSIDMNISGNTDTVVGTIENCASIIANGSQDGDETGVDTITVDITAQGVPAYDQTNDVGGLLAYSVTLSFQGGWGGFWVDTHISTQPGVNMIIRNAGSDPFDASDTLPDGDGSWNAAVLDIGDGAPEEGFGVLERVTLKTTATTGVYPARLIDNVHLDASEASLFPDVTNLAFVSVNTPCAIEDSDGDGVYDPIDNCPANHNPDQWDGDNDGSGTSCDVDDDNDGVCDVSVSDASCEGLDLCLNTASSSIVDEAGCSRVQLDGDLDGLCDTPNPSVFCSGVDSCPGTQQFYGIPTAEIVDSAGCFIDQVDTDWDGVCDPGKSSSLWCAGSDNCLYIENWEQINTDTIVSPPGDPLGDACDQDDDNDGALDGPDNCRWIPNAIQENGDADPLGDLCDNCPTITNANQANNDGDALGDACDQDDDNAGVYDVDEIACGANPFVASNRPERIDGQFAGVDDNANGQIDEASPQGAANYDCDGDGFKGSAEDHVFGAAARGNQDPCGTNGWPAELVAGSFSENKINVSDLASFVTPVRHLNTDVGTHAGDVRWDLVPGSVFGNDINISDMAAITTGAGAHPAMLHGARAFNGPMCPWAP